MSGTMNERMARVFGGLLLAFAAVIGMLTWWQVFEAGYLNDKAENNQRAYVEQRIERGKVRTADGVLVAASRGHTSDNGDTVYARRYPRGGLLAHLLGYSTTGRAHTGVEKTWNDYLTGSTRELVGILDKLRGEDAVQGDDLTLTIDAKAQRVALQQLGTRRGAVVALDPRTGEVLVLASTPGYDPNELLAHYARVARRPGAPLLNRATSALYPPGSTFKVITAAAALEDGVSPDDTFPGGTSYDVPGAPPVKNFGGESFGTNTLTEALTHSINTTFARLGVRLGQDKLRAITERFGFYSDPPLDDLPLGERLPSGLYDDRRHLLGADEGVDVAREAIGQERLGVTPLQMALVAATIANKGVMMHPYAVESATTPGGHVEERARPSVERKVLSPEVASQLTEMMKQVVKEGTGTASAVQGIEIAGKTGTADTPSGNQVWFICFAPADHPKVAIAVTMESQPSGATGGPVAGPVAKAVIESLLGRGTAASR